ncbi:MAG TPA: TetR/AcrR family transcriptional regulator [Steroidobacteraceae bacterium]|jgi:AcrR family transcriptional regulator|nr:TetR/AcrR family transcriptional regulator [Steroidobacteraceae bacterium]
MPSPKRNSPVRARKISKERTFIEQARRTQILDAALELFAGKGYDRTSLSDIAGTLGISKGVISYHFEGKAELGAEALRHMLRRYGDFVRARLDSKATVREKLLELPAACIDFVGTHPANYSIYLDTLGSFGTAADRQRFMAWADAGMRSLICDLLEQAQEQKEIPRFPVRPLADVLQAAVDGLTEQASVAPGVVDLPASKKVLQRILEAIFDGRISVAGR